MSEKQASTRLLAPAALAVFAVVLVIVVIGSISGGSDDSEPSGASRNARTQTTKSTKTTTQKTTDERVYVVKSGDNLATISDKTGVPIDQIEVLNPDIDPRALVAGQKIKIK